MRFKEIEAHPNPQHTAKKFSAKLSRRAKPKHSSFQVILVQGWKELMETWEIKNFLGPQRTVNDTMTCHLCNVKTLVIGDSVLIILTTDLYSHQVDFLRNFV